MNEERQQMITGRACAECGAKVVQDIVVPLLRESYLGGYECSRDPNHEIEGRR